MDQVDKVIELVRHMLNQEAPEVQAAACEGVAKLMLAGMIADESVSRREEHAFGADSPHSLRSSNRLSCFTSPQRPRTINPSANV